jgi:hypothetical protein
MLKGNPLRDKRVGANFVRHEAQLQSFIQNNCRLAFISECATRQQYCKRFLGQVIFSIYFALKFSVVFASAVEGFV